VSGPGGVTRSLALLLPAALAGCSTEDTALPKYGRFEGHASAVFRTVAEPDLIPEGIAYDPQTGRVFLGSFRKSKIVVVDADGIASDFVAEREHGFQAGVGMRVDAKHRLLWACSGSAPHQRGGAAEAPPEKGLFVFDVDDATLRWKFSAPQSGPADIFNDVTLTADGAAFVSGFLSGKLYRADVARQTVEEFLQFPQHHAPNGIDLSADGRFLFVATGRDIAVVDPVSAQWYPLEPPAGENFIGIDGLYFHEDSLIAIQSTRGFGDPGGRVARLHLAPGYGRVERVSVLDADHPVWDQPTTGVLDGRMLYYVANSQFTKFDDAFTLAPLEELADVVVLQLAIGN
jgi:DNA-binding beta-propeller fold protein YncE